MQSHGFLRDAQNITQEDVVRRRAAPVAVEGVVDHAAADGRGRGRLDGPGAVDRLPYGDRRARVSFVTCRAPSMTPLKL